MYLKDALLCLYFELAIQVKPLLMAVIKAKVTESVKEELAIS